MKNIYLKSLVSSLIVTTSFLHAFGANKDIWSCRSTCIVVDQKANVLYNLGSIEGGSEINIREAFDVMSQTCLNKALAREIKADSIYLVQEQLRVDENKEENRFRSEESYSKRGFFKNMKYATTSESVQTNQEFSFEFNFADYDSCEPIESNPNGKSKYIGPVQPLG